MQRRLWILGVVFGLGAGSLGAQEDFARVRVVDGEGQPVAGAWVRHVVRAWPDRVDAGWARTDVEGMTGFPKPTELEQVDARAELLGALVHVLAPGFAPEAEAWDSHPAMGEVLVVELEQAQTLVGTLVDSHGEPLGGVRTKLVWEDPDPPARRQLTTPLPPTAPWRPSLKETAPDGSFVRSWPEDYEPLSVHVRGTALGRLDLSQHAAGRSLDLGELLWEAAPSSASSAENWSRWQGRVLTRGGILVPGVLPRSRIQPRTGAQGAFDIMTQADLEGLSSWPVWVGDALLQAERVREDEESLLLILDGRFLHVRVVDARGRPVPGAVVQVDSLARGLEGDELLLSRHSWQVEGLDASVTRACPLGARLQLQAVGGERRSEVLELRAADLADCHLVELRLP